MSLIGSFGLCKKSSYDILQTSVTTDDFNMAETAIETICNEMEATRLCFDLAIKLIPLCWIFASPQSLCNVFIYLLNSGAYGLRTRDLHAASVARSQLRQYPISPL